MSVSSDYIENICVLLNEKIQNPVTELYYINPYTLLVAVVLSAQSTDKGVNKATEPLFRQVVTPEEMVELGEEKLKEYIKTIGLFNTKAKNIISLSETLIKQHHGKVPATREDLMALPGVGRKTANVVLNVAFHLPTIPVDTHVMRLSNRLGLTASSNPDQIEKRLEHLVPATYLKKIHHLFILHGRYTCKSRSPLCETCVLRDICPSSSVPSSK